MAKRTDKGQSGRDQGWRVVFYKTVSDKQPVRDFLDVQSSDVRRAIREGFALLREKNVLLGMPHVRKMAGRDFWELRTRVSGDIYRTFYFAAMDRKFVLLHAFQKKSGKTPTKELEIAGDRMKDYLARNQQREKRRKK